MQNPPITMLQRAFRDFQTVTHCYSLVVAFCVFVWRFSVKMKFPLLILLMIYGGENKTELLRSKEVSEQIASKPTNQAAN